jgi:hypothetical protein
MSPERFVKGESERTFPLIVRCLALDSVAVMDSI